MRPEGFPTPTWEPPNPYGYAQAVSSAGSVGAPLLAGFTVALIALVLPNGSSMRAPGLALDLLSVAAVVLLASVQLTFMAARYAVLPSELEAWWPDLDIDERRAQLREEQREHHHLHLRWSRRFRWAYNLGILFLLAAVAVILMPPSHHHHLAERWVAAGIVAAGLFAEVAWIVGSWAEGLGSQWWRQLRLR